MATMTAEEKVLKALSERPRSAGEFPMPQRRMLRVLETTGRIEYDTTTNTWRLATAKEE